MASEANHGQLMADPEVCDCEMILKQKYVCSCGQLRTKTEPCKKCKQQPPKKCAGCKRILERFKVCKCDLGWGCPKCGEICTGPEECPDDGGKRPPTCGRCGYQYPESKTRAPTNKQKQTKVRRKARPHENRHCDTCSCDTETKKKKPKRTREVDAEDDSPMRQTTPPGAKRQRGRNDSSTRQSKNDDGKLETKKTEPAQGPRPIKVVKRAELAPHKEGRKPERPSANSSGRREDDTKPEREHNSYRGRSRQTTRHHSMQERRGDDDFEWDRR